MTQTNGWLVLADPYAAMTFAANGFDSVTLDMQHGMFDVQSIAAVLFALAGKSVKRLVRPADATPALVGKILDLGADGLIVPLINSAEEAQNLVEACYYPPRGRRSFGPLAASAQPPGAPASPPELYVMIETREGFAAVEAIAAVEGVTGLYVGPNDLALALGLGPGSDRTEPVMLERLARIASVAASHGKRAGLYCASPAYAAKMVEVGFDFLTLISDTAALGKAGGDALKAFRHPAAPG